MMQKKVLLLPNLTKHNTAELVPKIIRQLILCGCQPLALTEVEAYGPEDAEDTPVPAPAE